MLVEKNELTHGSTWHAAGLCTHFAHNATIQELRATSVRLYRDILPARDWAELRLSSLPVPCASPAIRTGWMSFAHVAGLSEFTGYQLEI